MRVKEPLCRLHVLSCLSHAVGEKHSPEDSSGARDVRGCVVKLCLRPRFDR